MKITHILTLAFMSQGFIHAADHPGAGCPAGDTGAGAGFGAGAGSEVTPTFTDGSSGSGAGAGSGSSASCLPASAAVGAGAEKTAASPTTDDVVEVVSKPVDVWGRWCPNLIKLLKRAERRNLFVSLRFHDFSDYVGGHVGSSTDPLTDLSNPEYNPLIKHRGRISKLYFSSYTDFSSLQAHALKHFLMDNSVIQELDLTYMVNGEYFDILKDGLLTATSLKKLILQYSGPDSIYPAAIADLIRNSKSLETLHIWGSSVDDDGAEIIMEALSHNTTLKDFVLNSQKMGSRALRCVSDMLRVNKTLERVHFSCNFSIDDRFDVLGENTTLKSFSLRGVDKSTVSELFLYSIMKSLEGQKPLKELALRYNGIQTSGASAMAKALRKNTSLETLDLSGNELSPYFIERMMESLEGNNTLKKIIMVENGIDFDSLVMKKFKELCEGKGIELIVPSVPTIITYLECSSGRK